MKLELARVAAGSRGARRLDAQQRRLAVEATGVSISAPEVPTTRWHGTMTETGLRPTAAPTARLADGAPRRRAMSP